MATSSPQFPPDAPSLGEGRYVLVSRIGSGSVGAVYRAYDRKLRVWRAVKVLLAELSGVGWVRDQFESDAHTLAQLEHPNLVRVYDVGHAADLPFVVMELVSGGTLAHWTARFGAMPPRLACDATLQVVYALCAVHGHGTVHGDVKPSGVLVGPNGSCKLTDFAIVAPPPGAGHLAPEQFAGGPIDARADLYGVGATFWSILRGEDLSDGARGLIGIDGVLHPILRGCLAERREDRFQSGHDLAVALEDAAARLPAADPGTPELCLDRSEEEVDVGAHAFGELEALLDDSRPRTSATPSGGGKALPYFMPPDDPQRRRRSLLERHLDDLGGPEPTEEPEWVDARTLPRPGHEPLVVEAPPVPTTATPKPVDAVKILATPSPAPAPDRRPATPAPSPQKPRPTPKPAPIRPEDVAPEDPPNRWVTYVLVPMGFVLAAIICVMLVVVLIVGSGMASLTDAADAATHSQIRLYRVLNDERDVVEQLAELGADRTALEKAYILYMEKDDEPERIQAAMALALLIDEQARTRIEQDGLGADQVRVAHHVRQIRGALEDYHGSVVEWRGAASGPLGRVLVAIGVGPSPP